MTRILGVDPSFTATGIVVVEFPDARVVHGEKIATKPNAKKRRIRVADDNGARAMIIANRLLQLQQEFTPGGWVVETPPGGTQSAVAARGLAIVHGVLVGISQARGIPVEWVSPDDVKRVGGSGGASKADVLAGTRRFLDWGDVLEGEGKGAREAIGDAAGGIVAAWDGLLVSMARNNAGGVTVSRDGPVEFE